MHIAFQKKQKQNIWCKMTINEAAEQEVIYYINWTYSPKGFSKRTNKLEVILSQ